MSARVGSNPVGVRRLLIGALSTLVLALALSAPAQAEIPNHPFVGALISGLEPEPKPLRPKLEKPCGVTVTPEGEIFVSDYARQSVIGTTLTELFPDNGPCGLAYDGNNLYVNEWHGTVVNPETGVIDSGRVTGIAVHPLTKDLYVSHRNSVAVYEAPVEPGNVPAHVFGTGTLGNAYGVAVSAFPATEGDVYVADAQDHSVKVYDPSFSMTTPSQVIKGGNTAAGRFVSLADSSLAVDQSNGNFFVVDNTTPLAEHPSAAVYEFNADGVFRGQLEHSIVHGTPVGIAIDESATPANGQVYVTSGNGTSVVIPPELGPPVTEQGSLYAFGPAGPGQSINVSTSGTGDGTVTSDPVGINCPAGCEAELNSGASVTLTATPEAGSAFAGWSGGGCSGTGICQVILNSATTVNAEFIPAPTLNAVAAAKAKTAESQAGPASPGLSAATLKLGRPAAQGANTVLLTVTAPEPGTLTATAKGLKSAHASLAAAGSTTLRLHLNRRGRQALAKSKAGRLSLRLAVSFKPSDGASGSVVGKTVTFKHTK
jgi:Divergent InlB B-repeat domain